MKPYKNFLRIWFAITSVLSFAGGWIILAHSPKPVQSTSSNGSDSLAPLPTLPPIQTFGTSNNSSNGFQLFSPNTGIAPSSGFSFPRMRSGGS
jgi:hypothetical protein